MVLLNSCILDPGIRTRRYSVTAHEHDQVTPGPSFNRRDTRILESKWRIRTRRIPPRRRHRKSLGVSSVPLALMTPLRHPSTSFKRAVRFLRFRRSLSLRRLVRPAWLEGDSLDDFRAILSGSRDSGGGPAASSAVAGTTPPRSKSLPDVAWTSRGSRWSRQPRNPAPWSAGHRSHTLTIRTKFSRPPALAPTHRSQPEQGSRRGDQGRPGGTSQ